MAAWRLVRSEKGKGQERFHGGTKKLLRIMSMFIILIAVMASWVYILVKMYQITYFKYVQFTGLPGWLRQ